MKYALLFFIFSTTYVHTTVAQTTAQVPVVQEQIQTPLGMAPVSSSYQPPPAKTDDILPIAPMRSDERVDMPETVFSSINKNEKWERYERGENLKETGNSTIMLANKDSVEDKGRKPSSVKGKKGAKASKKEKTTKNAKTSKDKKAKSAKVTKPTKKATNAKSTNKNQKRKPAQSKKKSKK